MFLLPFDQQYHNSMFDFSLFLLISMFAIISWIIKGKSKECKVYISSLGYVLALLLAIK